MFILNDPEQASVKRINQVPGDPRTSKINTSIFFIQIKVLRINELYFRYHINSNQSQQFRLQKKDFIYRQIQGQVAKNGPIITLEEKQHRLGFIITVFGIYTFLLQPPQVVVPQGGQTKILKVNQAMQGVGITTIVVLSIGLAIIYNICFKTQV